MPTALVDVLWTARYDYEPGWTLTTHEHAFFQIIYCLGGRGTLTLAGDAHSLAPRAMFLIAPAQAHGLAATTAVKTLDIKFRVRDARLKRHLLRLPPVWRRADKALAHLLERIRHEGALRQPYFREQCAASLLDILIALVRHGGAQPRAAQRAAAALEAGGDTDWLDRAYPSDVPDAALTDPVARQAVRYLQEHYARPVTSRELSRVVGVSERHLRACLQQTLGQSPPRYLMHYRVDRAKDLIGHREFALKDVAVRTGFKSIHHFTRTFTRLAGLSPAAWRRAYHDGIRRDVTIDPRFVNDHTPVIGLSARDRASVRRPAAPRRSRQGPRRA